jgi:maleate cis-trans isomerase
VEIGYQIGRQTFEEHPDADGIYMPGGSWTLNKVVTDLEAEFKKPVLGHHLVNVWNMATLLGMWSPRQGLGRLYSAA